MNRMRGSVTRFIAATIIVLVALHVEAATIHPVITPATAQELYTRHIQEVVMSGASAPIDRLPATQIVKFDITLPLVNEVGLTELLDQLYDPQSPSYHHFLTPEQFSARFGPSQRDFDVLVAFMKARGVTVVGGSRQSMNLQLAAPAAIVESVFHVTLNHYQHPTEQRIFYSADKEPSIDLAVPLWHISGLDNFVNPHPLKRKKPASTFKRAVTSGTCPNTGAYCGGDMRSAYYGTGPLTGAGQSVGLVEFYGYNTSDLTTYLTNTGQTNSIPINNISVDGSSLTCNAPSCDDSEQILDLTQVIGMAPGLAQINVYVSTTSDTAILSAMTSVPPKSITGRVDAQLSCSWGWSPADPAADDPYFKKMAAQGQSFLTAAGDSGSYTTKSTSIFPADDAYVTVVGGTALITDANGAWVSESTWSAGGGGYFKADNILIPTWQTPAITVANKGSTTYRNSPDVAGEANFDFYVCYNQNGCSTGWGGTSFAAPMWAAYLALVNQQAALNTGATTGIGFINPTIYKLGLGTLAPTPNYSYANAMHDVTSGSNGNYTAAAGFDLATGWGSPNGASLIAVLSPPAGTPGFTLTATPGSVSLLAGANTNIAITSTSFAGFTDTGVNLSASVATSSTGISATVTLNNQAVGSAGTVNISVANGTAAGTYTITIKGAGLTISTVTAQTTITLTVLKPSFTLSPSASTLSMVQGSTNTSITVTPTFLNGFNTPVSFSTKGQPAGVTVAIPNSDTVGSGLRMTVTVPASTSTGNSTITITGTGGGVTATTTVRLTITAASFSVATNSSNFSFPHGTTSAPVTVTTTILGTLTAAPALTISGLPSTVTASFSPSTLSQASGSPTSLLTFKSTGTTASSTATTVTITAKSGGISKTTTLRLSTS